MSSMDCVVPTHRPTRSSLPKDLCHCRNFFDLLGHSQIGSLFDSPTLIPFLLVKFFSLVVYIFGHHPFPYHEDLRPYVPAEMFHVSLKMMCNNSVNPLILIYLKYIKELYKIITPLNFKDRVCSEQYRCKVTPPLIRKSWHVGLQ